MMWLFVMLVGGVLGAIPPLDAGQRTQLETASEAAGPDEAGLYALLANVAKWEIGRDKGTEGRRDEGGEGGLPAGVARPDWGALLAEPGAFRGDLFLVEGRYAGRQRRVELVRPGVWGGAVTEWGVVVDGTSGGGEASGGEVVAVVYFVDPMGEMVPPAGGEGARVRTVGRFYKVWTDRDAAGAERRYPVFVARSAEVVQGGAGGGLPGGSGAATAVFAAVLVLAAVLFMVKRMGRQRRGVASRRPGLSHRAERDDPQHDEVEDESEDVQPLPADPAEALERLRGAD